MYSVISTLNMSAFVCTPVAAAGLAVADAILSTALTAYRNARTQLLLSSYT